MEPKSPVTTNRKANMGDSRLTAKKRKQPEHSLASIDGVRMWAISFESSQTSTETASVVSSAIILPD